MSSAKQDQPGDALGQALDKISSTHDRFQEAHFWIHMLERYYHSSDPFRWHLNSFLRAAKEVPQLLLMELQNEKGFKAWFKEHKTKRRRPAPERAGQAARSCRASRDARAK
jgi:hypothetical protein